jgi:hypothetical protein
MVLLTGTEQGRCDEYKRRCADGLPDEEEHGREVEDGKRDGGPSALDAAVRCVVNVGVGHG